jgi:hypothetical protein
LQIDNFCSILILMSDKIKKPKLTLPAGFPPDLIPEIEKLVNELFVAEALESLADKDAKVFYQLIKGKKEFSPDVFEFLEEKKPGFLKQVYSKIEKQIEKILNYKVKLYGFTSITFIILEFLSGTLNRTLL